MWFSDERLRGGRDVTNKDTENKYEETKEGWKSETKILTN
jgi:hypothetical protein